MNSNLTLPEFTSDNEEERFDALLNWLREVCVSHDVYIAIGTAIVSGLDEVGDDDKRWSLKVSTGYIDAEVLDIPDVAKALQTEVYILRINDARTDKTELMWTLFIDSSSHKVVGFGRHRDPDAINIQPVRVN